MLVPVLRAPCPAVALLLTESAVDSPAGDGRVHLKTTVASFTHEHEVRLLDGRIHWRAQGAMAWELLPPHGLPHGEFEAPAAVTALSADGDNLIALDAQGVVFYMKFHDLRWVNQWGPTGLADVLKVPLEFRAFAMSHRGPLAGGYEDLDGNSHPISAGVTTLYGLSADGRRLQYTDPWIPPTFEREVCLPLRGAYEAEGMSASASMLFVIDRAGRMFTRLADFDTMGNNPGLRYTYARGVHKGVRTLPPEDWRPQPSPPGRVTSLITVLQTGAGNAARELRVEGQDAAGTPGYFVKALLDARWRFVPTGAPLLRALLPLDSAPAVIPERGRDYEGAVLAPRGARGLVVRAERFDPSCSPAQVVFSLGEERFVVPLHTRDVRTGILRQAVNDKHPAAFDLLLRGMFLVPKLPGGPLGRALRKLFGSRSQVPVHLEVERDGMKVRQVGWAQMFGGLRLFLRPE